MEEVFVQENSEICALMNSENIIPDYVATAVFATAGQHTLTLTVDNGNGVKTMTKSVRVEENPAFIITRSQATRLFPYGTSPASFTVQFNQDFTGTVSEKVLASFIITNTDATIVQQ